MSAATTGAAPRRRFAIRGAPWAIGLSVGWLALAVLLAIGADWIGPFSPTRQSLLLRLKPPSFTGGPAGHWLGTDHLGRDVFSRLLAAMRVSLLIALFGTWIGALLGTVLGVVAAHFRGVVGGAVMALVDFQASMPFLIIALAVLAFLGNSFVLFVFVVGLHGWEVYARITRGQVLAASARGFAGAIRDLGAHPLRLYGRHVLPNIAGVLIVQVTLSFPETILLETSLSFLGLGVQPPRASLGLMLGEGRNYLLSAPWIGLPAGIVIFLTTLAMSLVGDWVRDRLDPRLRTARS